MNSDHVARVNQRITEICQAFNSASSKGYLGGVRRQWQLLMAITSQAIADSHAARLEADSLATELSVYRPTRSETPAAPCVYGISYVHTGKSPWICAAKEIRSMVQISPLAGRYYEQEHCVPDRKTLCGNVTAYPVTERFTSGGWPRLRELCPKCTELLLLNNLEVAALTETDTSL